MSCMITYIIEELNQGVGSQLSIILDDLIVGKDVDALHLIQTWRESVLFEPAIPH